MDLGKGKFLIEKIKDGFKEVLSFFRRFKETVEILRPSERKIIVILSLVVIICEVILFRNYYLSKTTINPQKGGVYVEGILGAPKYLNPVLARTEIDRNITKILFPPLISFNGKGELTPNLVKEFKIIDEGERYDFILGDDIFWHDGERLTSDDIDFTLSILQDEGYNGPFSQSFNGVKLEKKSETEFSLILEEANSSFSSILSEVGILPVHKLKDVKPELIDKNDFNQNPIGYGKYSYKAIKEKSNSYVLKRAETYKKSDSAYFEEIDFRSYLSMVDLVEAYRRGEINGLAGFSPRDIENIDRKTFRSYQLKIPRFAAVFFNLNKEANKELKFRQALASAVNKDKIVQEVYGGEAEALKTVIPSFALGFSAEVADYPYNPDLSRAYLSQLQNINLEPLIYTTDDSSLQKIAELVSADWQAVGIKPKVIVIDLLTLEKTIIPSHQYDAIILGENLDYPPDPYPYFHSSQIDGGLNISCYKNLAVDYLLEEARLSTDNNLRGEKLKNFSQIIAEDLPVIPLASAPYLYGANISIKGVPKTRIAQNSSDRFLEIGSWYIKSERKSNF